MGKFPGKLTRNFRTRISVRQSESAINIHPDNVLFQAEGNRISLGLDIFHYLFGTDEQVVDDFRGFTREEVETSIELTRKEQQTIVDLSRPTGLVIAEWFPNAEKTDIDTNYTSKPVTLHETFHQDVKLFSSPRPRSIHANPNDLQTNVSEAKLDRPMSKNRVKRGFNPRPRGPKPGHKTMCTPTGRPRGRPKLTHTKVLLGVGENMLLKNRMANKLLQKAKKSSNIHNVTPGTTGDSQQDKGGVVGVRKFVLPCRSAHSSRVIKPSKRCLESEEVLNEPRSNQSHSFVSRTLNSRSIQTVVLKEPKLILASAKASYHNLAQRSRYNGGDAATNILSTHTKFSDFDRTGKHNSFQAPGRDSLSADGKGRWKPTYKVQLDLHELNVFGAGTSKFSGKQMRDMDLKPAKIQSDSHQISSAFSSSTKSSSSQSTDTDHPGPVSVDDEEICAFDAKSEDRPTSKSTVISKPNTPVLPCTSSSAIPPCTSSNPNKSLGKKVVIRKARLQLDSKTNSGNDTTVPKDRSNTALPGTVVCGVCGAVRFYKFVKQARKFGIFCCESCRKFISKMMGIQKVISKPPVLKCLGGDVQGSCKNVPIVRSHQWKSKSPASELRSVYKARCPACWLKNCLRFFKMPGELKSKLSRMLPSNMQVSVEDYQPSLDDISDIEFTPVSLSSKEDRKKLKKKVFSYEMPALKKRLKKVRHKDATLHEDNEVKKSGDTYSENKAKKKIEVVNSSKKSKEKKVNSIKKKESKVLSKKDKGNKIESQKKKTTLPQQKALEKASKKLLKSSIKQATKRGRKGANNEKSQNRKKNTRHRSTSGVESLRRQKLEIKGPRVKHVCRSASVVLGQPQATFPKVDKALANNTLPEAGVVSSTKKASKGSYCQDCDESSKSQDCVHSVESSQETGSKKSSVALADLTKNVSTGSQADEVPSSSTSRKANKQTPLPPVPVRSMQIPRKLPLQEVKSLVSIDFWESYDPEEVTNSGFGLIGSEPFHTRAICFLCGSAGIEKLIHCASCCDPYHRFCLYDGLRDPTMSLVNSKDEWRLDWLCQRCSVCHTCGLGSAGPQLGCRRCRRTYHAECLGSSGRLHPSPDRPWVCGACLRCNSCGGADVEQFVGNLPFCAPCFVLRKKGNYCPLCQKCYEDDDFDTKMMECGQCKCWIHAKCEDISDEKYLVLGFLPESVEFVCRMCCPLAPWRSTVEEVLKAGLKGVIQVLIKKCKARHLLSLGPKKQQCSCQPAGAEPKRIRFLDEPDDGVGDKAVVKRATQVHIKEEIENNPQEKTDNVKKEVEAFAKEVVRIDTKEIGTGTEERTETGVDDVETAKNRTVEVDGDTVEAPRSQLSKRPIVCLVKVDLESENNLPTSSVAGQETTPDSSDECVLESGVKKVVLLEERNGPLKLLRDKYNLKDCSVCVEKLDKGTQHSDVDLEDKGGEFLDSTFSDCSGRSPEKLNSSLTPTDSGIGSTDDELKLSTSKSVRVYAPSAEVDYASGTGEEPSTTTEVGCQCFKNDVARPTLLSIEEKVDNDEFSSLLQFDEEMELLLNDSSCQDLANLYHRKLKDTFPWFDPKHAQVSRFPCPREQQPQEATREDTHNGNVHTALEDVWVMPECAIGKSVDYYYSDFVVEDVRACTLCHNLGDGLPCEEGRLLYCGQNEWAHANCALWSSEVFEEIDGSLQNVHSAVFRGRKLACAGCGAKGASVGCCSRNCFVAYHFPCARADGCRFMEDKTFYCPAHVKEASGRVVQNNEEFDLRRPIYVELDRKKKKFVEPDEVRFMIGSLLVERLGVVVPAASDNVDAVIPDGFVCTRLYWSSVEPWRIVRYTVKTVLPRVKCEPGVDHGRNVTIDHELDRWMVRHKLEDVYEWHRQLGKKPSNEETPGVQTDEDRVARQVMDYVLDAVCSKDVYENCLSDPQNAAELLPPELKDAIFEDLPHDLLDGISMQDIFPKMMSFEDCFSTDTIGECKEEQQNEDVLLNSEVEENMKPDRTDSEVWFGETKDVETAPTRVECVRGPQKISKELKRSRSEVISVPTTVTVGTRSHKRSCSLTWSCRLDGSKRRKVQGRATRSSDADKMHRLQELRLPDGVLVTLAATVPAVPPPSPNPPGGGRHGRTAEEGKENKCMMTWGGRGPRIPQLDGAAESSSSGSERGSPPPPPMSEEEPVRCSRCHSTYRTRLSYERHLPTCSNDFILSTSESDSETRSSEGGDLKKEPEDVGYDTILPKTESPFNRDTLQSVAPTEDNQTFIFSDLQNSSPPAVHEPQIVEAQPVIHNEVYGDTKVAIRAQPKAKFTYQRGPTKPRGGRPKQCANIVARENKVTTAMSHSVMSQTQPLPPQQPMVQPAVIVQQVPSTSMMPAYLESFQQQTGHNLQYIASIDIQSSNGFNKPAQYITNGIIPGTFQLQSAPDYGNLSLLPGVQIASQPTMLGTIIQQPTAAIQCGVVGQDQIVLGGTPLEVYTDQSGGMFLANQPTMYYGLETIVSNTVMSSSQYVAGMQGMVAASSSYSATTTQVYQTNKIESVVDQTSGYVILPSAHLSPGPNVTACPNPVRMNLPAPTPRVQPPPVVPCSQPRGNRPPWATVRKYLPPTRNNQLERARVPPPTPIHRPRPCYMPNPSPAVTTITGFQQAPTRLKPIVTVANSSMPDRTSSFKYTPANTMHVKKDYQEFSNRIKQLQMGPVGSHVPKPPRTPLILKPVCKVVKEMGEVRKPAVVIAESNKPTESKQTVEAKAPPTDVSKSKAESIKLVIQKSPQNGYYRISHHVPHSNVQQLAAKEAKQECNKSAPQTKPNVLPLADNVKTNKPAKRRWQPKEKPTNDQPKPPPCKMVYEVCSKDGFSCRSTSITEVWEKVFEAVQSARIQHKMPPLLRNPFNNGGSRGLQMLGLNHSGLRYLVEQLPGVNRCVKYRPLHHEQAPPPVMADDGDLDSLPEENRSGCCRTEPFASRAPYDLFSWLASRHRRPPKLMTPTDETGAVAGRRASSTNLPMAMRFRHLKETSKEAVGVYRSHIHGRGLFCLRDIEAGEMVIEYAGEVIRSTLTDYRERLYDDKDIGCYMFRIDDHLVVDATMRGNAARFINHSCEPNCYSKVVDILGKKHILIFALRRIPQGEELTYDYKFPFEDIKIPCTCGSRRCRKYLN